MKRILILGSCGAGKSTFAKRLHEILGLPIIHLDEHCWMPGWVRPDKSAWEKTVQDLISGEKWIMDGNYRSSLHLRIPAADTVILLDFPRMTCLWRILKRRLRKNRLDCIVGCREKIDFELLFWILWKFPRVNRRQVLKTLEEVKNKKDIYVLKTNKDVNRFIISLANPPRQH